MTNRARGHPRRALRISATVLAAVVAVALASAGGLLVLRDPPVVPFEPLRPRPRPQRSVPAGTAEPVPADRTRSLPEELHGPEDIVVDHAGRISTSTADGRIVRTTPGRRGFEVFARVGGRPLGMVSDADGRLIVANHGVGLQAVAPTGDVTVLADSADGQPIRFGKDGEKGVVCNERGEVKIVDVADVGEENLLIHDEARPDPPAPRRTKGTSRSTAARNQSWASRRQSGQSSATGRRRTGSTSRAPPPRSKTV